MTILLDTHVLIWAWTGDKRLGEKIKLLLSAEETRSIVSLASFWELAIKQSVGKLDLKLPLDELISALPEFRVELMPIAMEHIRAVGKLPMHHRDPFDRMLIAQAKHEGMHLLTADPIFKEYDVPLVDL